MLTNAAVKAARPRAAAYKLGDGQGLYLYVAPTGTKSFRMKARLNGRELLLTFGCWPLVSLADARARCAAALEQLGRGEDPRVVPDGATFAAIARRWHVHQATRWTSVHAVDVLASLERDVIPAIGTMPIGAITAPVVLAALRSIEARGRLETARRVCQRISAVFAFAMSEGRATENPAAIVGRALVPPPAQRRQPALVDVDEVRELLAAAERVRAAPAIKLASRFLALTAVRLAAVRGATWGEIEGVDWSDAGGDLAPLWRVPAARMKLAAAKKRDSVHDHLVPLSPAAVVVLRAARANMHRGDAYMHAGALIFAGRGGAAPIGEAAIGALYDRAGFAGRHVPHGWRASFATILNERMPAERAAIDLALAHSPKDKVEAAYNRSEQLGRRRALFDVWGEILTA